MKILVIGKPNFTLVKSALAQVPRLPINAFEERRSLKTALEALQVQAFDFVFCDLFPARQPLFDRLAKLREAAPEATLIAIVPDGSKSWDNEVLRAGADDVLGRSELNGATLSRVFRYALEHQAIRREFLKASSDAQQSAQVKSNFMANMSHEIRTPLNLIIGTADLLNETPLNPQQKRLVKSFSNAGSHLLSLLADVLDLSQLESQGLRCVDASFSISELFMETCEIVTVLCRAKKLSFDYLLDHQLPERVIGDKLRLRQVLLNILNNAIKFTSRGGIQLRLEAIEKTNSACTLRIQVKDTGIGIAHSELSRVFDCFYQSDRGLERQYRGSGLGLSIVKAIVDNYGGDVQIESQPGHGTEVNIKMRLNMDIGGEALEVPYLRGKRILVSTHGTLEAQSISQQLQRLGATTVWLSSGNAALHRLKSDPEFDCAILDVQTSDLGALQLLALDDFTFPREKVVVLLPPVHRRTDPADCERLGIDMCLYKPFSPNQFVTLISRRTRPAVKRQMTSRKVDLLVVDDDFETRELMAAFLARTPHQVTYAKDGNEALALAEHHSFDVILMDIEMPGLNGYETTRRLKTLATCHETKILGLSANAFPENIEEARQVGFSGYLTKPIRKERLLASIVDCIHAQGFYEAIPSALDSRA